MFSRVLRETALLSFRSVRLCINQAPRLPPQSRRHACHNACTASHEEPFRLRIPASGQGVTPSRHCMVIRSYSTGCNPEPPAPCLLDSVPYASLGAPVEGARAIGAVGQPKAPAKAQSCSSFPCIVPAQGRRPATASLRGSIRSVVKRSYQPPVAAASARACINEVGLL